MDIPSLGGHTRVQKDPVPATCTEAGLSGGEYCSVCNKIFEAQIKIPALGHTVVADPAVAETCTKTGLTAGSHCSVCKEVIVAQITIPAFGHTTATDSAVAATCTKSGLTEGSHCVICREVLIPQHTIPAKGHKSVIDKRVEPTCRIDGLTEGSHCSVCGEVLVAQKAIMAKHKTVNGACSVCGIPECTPGLEFSLTPDGRSYILTDYGECESWEIVIGIYNDLDVTEIGRVAFNQAPIYSITFAPGSACHTIGYAAFDYCYNLKKVVLPDALQYIGYGAFEECYRLTEMNEIPASVTVIGSGAFSDCPITTISISPLNEAFVVRNNALYTADMKTLIKAGTALEGLYYVIPDGVETIAKGAMLGCDMKRVTIPSSVTSIGDDAFSCCYYLEKVTFASNSQITELPYRAFRRCHSLTEFVIPASITEIDSNAFEEVLDKEDVGNLTLYTERTERPAGWFTTCPIVFDYLQSDVADDGNIYLMVGGLRFAIRDGEATLVCQPILYEANIPAYIDYEGGVYPVTSIAPNAFANSHYYLTKVTIPATVTEIQDSTFERCETLKEVVFASGSACRRIGANAFYISGIEAIVLPASVEEIGEYAFASCSYLKSVSFESDSRLRKIEKYAFRFCDSLETVYLPGGIEEMDYYIFYDACEKFLIYLPIREDRVPEGWDEDWNTYGGTVIWGYTGN